MSGADAVGSTGDWGSWELVLLSQGNAAAASQLHRLVAVGPSEPRLTRQDLSTGARIWNFNVKFDC